MSKPLDSYTALDSTAFEDQIHLGENGICKPIYPSELGRSLTHVEMDYNYTVLNNTLAGYRIYPNGQTPSSHPTPNDFSGDVGKLLSLKKEGDDFYWTTVTVADDGDWSIDGTNLYYSSGKIGIGTTSPDSVFHIVGAYPQITVEDNVTGSGPIMTLGVGTHYTVFNSENHSSALYDFRSYGNSKLKIMSDGALRINDSESSGNWYQFPLVDGTVDQVLTTDGNGQLSWANQTGSGGSLWTQDGNDLEYSSGNIRIGSQINSANNPSLNNELDVVSNSPRINVISTEDGADTEAEIGIFYRGSQNTSGYVRRAFLYTGRWDNTSPESYWWRTGTQSNHNWGNTGTYYISERRSDNWYDRISIESGAFSGGITFENSYTFPITDGNNGETLITDGNGQISWGESGGLTNWSEDSNGNLLPGTDATFDIGSPTFQVNHLFVANNSIWVGDSHKISVSQDGEVEIKKRDKDSIPSTLSSLGATSNDIITWCNDNLATSFSTMSEVGLRYLIEFADANYSDSAPWSVDTIFDSSIDYLSPIRLGGSEARKKSTLDGGGTKNLLVNELNIITNADSLNLPDAPVLDDTIQIKNLAGKTVTINVNTSKKIDGLSSGVTIENREMMGLQYIDVAGELMWIITKSFKVAGGAGADGKSAYQLWLDSGNEGSQSDFLLSLKGNDGAAGAPGVNGKSAHELYNEQNGTTVDVAGYLGLMQGQDGADGAPGVNGLSALELYNQAQTPENQVEDAAAFAAAITGKDGADGAQGPQGLQGIQGVAGLDGAPGVDGLSAMELYNQAQTPENQVEDAAAFAAAITGKDGVDGAQGPQGPQGLQGVAGLDGAKGDKGDTGAQGPQGPQGLQGPEGDQGIQGVAGPQGAQGIAGPQGAQGDAGRGIQEFTYDEEGGYVIVTYDDGTDYRSRSAPAGGGAT